MPQSARIISLPLALGWLVIGMGNSTEKVSLAEAREALLRSGYLIESRLDTVLRQEGYYIDANVAFPDPETGKSRELDLYAMRALRAGPEEFDFIFFVLLIECVNNPAPLTLITKEPLVPFFHKSEIKFAGLPVRIRETGNSWVSIPDYLDMEKYHHYCRGRIATQFCSFAKKKASNEWMAYHDEVQFDAFRKLSAAVDHFMHAHFNRWSFSDKREPINIEFYYPVLVVQGELMECRPAKKSLKLSKGTHLQYRRSVFIRPKANEATEFQIDVIRESFFPKYLSTSKRKCLRLLASFVSAASKCEKLLKR